MINSIMMNKLIRIVYVIESLKIGGAEKQLVLLVKGLDSNKFSPMVITFQSGGELIDELRENGIEVVELDSTFKIKTIYRLWKLLLQIKPEVCHLFGGSAGIYGRVAAAFCSVPKVIVSERSSILSKNGVQKYVERILLKLADLIICNSNHVRKDLINSKLADPCKVLTIHNGYSFSKLMNCKGKEKDEVKIGYLANFRIMKNHLNLIRAFAILNQRVSGFKLLLAGDGECRDLIEREIANHKLKEKIYLLGIVNPNEYFQDIDIYVHPSKWEGLSNSLIEAMSFSIACIASDIPGNREIIQNNKLGILFDDLSPESIAKKIEQLVVDERLRTELGKAASLFVRENFASDRMIDAYQEIYSSS